MKRGTPDHPKTRALARALQVPLAQAVGTLEMLWQWTARFAPTGAVGRFGSPVIAESCAWTGDPDVLIAAMTAADSRFLDSDEEHGLIVHDWPDHADDMVHRQLARAGTRFANGDMPRLTRLSSEERRQAEAAFKKGARRAPKVRPKAHDVRPAVPGRAVAVPGLAVPGQAGSPNGGDQPSGQAPPEETRDRPADRPGGRKNPFVGAKRDDYEREALRLTADIGAITGEDGAEIFAKAAHYEGALRQKVNPASLSDDRLLNTVLDLRATLKAERDKRPGSA